MATLGCSDSNSSSLSAAPARIASGHPSGALLQPHGGEGGSSGGSESMEGNHVVLANR